MAFFGCNFVHCHTKQKPCIGRVLSKIRKNVSDKIILCAFRSSCRSTFPKEPQTPLPQPSRIHPLRFLFPPPDVRQPRQVLHALAGETQRADGGG